MSNMGINGDLNGINGMMNWNNTAPASCMMSRLENDAFLQNMSNTLGATNNLGNNLGNSLHGFGGFNNQSAATNQGFNHQLLGNGMMLPPTTGNNLMLNT